MTEAEIKGSIIALKNHLANALVRLGTLEAFLYMKESGKNPPPEIYDIFKKGGDKNGSR